MRAPRPLVAPHAPRTAPLAVLATLALTLAASRVGAQEVVLRSAGADSGTDVLRRVLAAPHVVRAGRAQLVLPRDSVVGSSLLVLGRPTYLASRVRGDVVVVGADLFLRPGADVSGAAVAIGGTVSATTLGTVGGGIVSLRDETYAVDTTGGRFLLDYRSLRAEEQREPTFQLAGIYGLEIPRYDRVDGLSLPAAVLLQFSDHALELEPSATYRSRLGVVDPALDIRTRELMPWRFLGRAARDTRTNERWIKGDLINSATTLWAGSDTRNYFRADVGEARVVRRIDRGAMSVEPYLGGRYERVWPVTAVGNVWSLFGRHDPEEKMARPNPAVEPGSIGSALAGLAIHSTGFARSDLAVDVEQGFHSPAGTSTFTQLTLDGEVQLPSFRTQYMTFRAHGVATHGASAPRARYAYLGGSGTLATLDPLEVGGTALLYVESRYLIPIQRIVLPVIGAPLLTLRDAFGSAGVGSLPAFQHEVGVGIGLSVVRLEYTRAVAGKPGHEVGIGFSMSRF